jgi:hypothetical protein
MAQSSPFHIVPLLPLDRYDESCSTARAIFYAFALPHCSSLTLCFWYHLLLYFALQVVVSFC